MHFAWWRVKLKCADYFWMRSAGFCIEQVLPTSPIHQNTAFTVFWAHHDKLETLKTLFKGHIAAFGEEHCKKFSRKMNCNELISVGDLPLPLREPLASPIDEWCKSLEFIQAHTAGLRTQFAEYIESLRSNLRGFVARADVAEAVFISNPDAAQRIESLLQEPHGSGGNRTRQKLRTAWSYAQRFCTKNDTTSFFGPISWGRFVNTQTELALVQWSPNVWLAQRKTFFESWVLQRIVEKINADCPSPEYLPLSLSPACHLKGNLLHYPLNKTRVLQGQILAVIQVLSRSSLNEVQLNGVLGFACADIVQHLVHSRILRKGFEISPRDVDAFSTLISSMHNASLPDSFFALWAACFRNLAEYRETYAMGDLAQRQKSLGQINNQLTEMGISLDRQAGAMYVGRYPIYEDCTRASVVTFNDELRSRLDDDFEPLGWLYQWLTRAVGFLLHQSFYSLFVKCQSQTHIQPQGYSGQLSLLAFLDALHVTVEDIQAGVALRIRQLFEVSWRPLLNSIDTEEIHLTTEDLNEMRVRLNKMLPDAEHFPVFGDGFYSPDLMLAADSLEALNQGNYRVVLGETHPGVHTLSQPVAAPFCPFVEDIEQDVRALFTRQRVFLADSPESFQRSHIDWPLVDRYAQIVLPSGGGCVPFDRRYAVGRAYVHLRDNRLVVGDLDGEFEEDLLCVASTVLHQLLFQLAGDVLPKFEPRRICHNNSVYKRRTWTFEGGSWPEAVADEFDAFIHWSKWKTENNLPRWVFVKCDTEPKPLYLDFENPLSIDMVATALKKARSALVSEMLPSPEDLWFSDSRGKVCCEIRTTFS